MAVTHAVDVEATERILAEWLSLKVGETTVDSVEVPAASGFSNQTILFAATWSENGRDVRRDLVARVQPSGPSIFEKYDVELEARVMNDIAASSPVPVPHVLFVETDAAVLGAPFIIMDRIHGRVPADDPPFPVGGWVMDLTDAERAVLHDNGLKALAQVHDVDPREVGLEDHDPEQPGADALERQLRYYEQYFEWAAEGDPNPTIEAAFEWLRENQPSRLSPVVLSWGDSRPGNLLFADDHSVAGVLDWEMVTLGERGLDLGYWLFTMRHHTEGVGVPLPGGFPTAEETVSRYEEISGHQVENIHYYEAFAGLRLSLFMVRVARLLVTSGALPPDTEMAVNNPSTQLLAKSLGLPGPQGTSVSFVGKR